MMAGIGDREGALTWLERSIEERGAYPVHAPIDPLWDDYRPDPRFTALMERVRSGPL